MNKYTNFCFSVYFFLLVLNTFAQTKVKDSFTVSTREKVKYSFTILALVEKSVNPTDTVKIKFTYSLLGANEVEELNENTFTFKMKYSKQNTITAMQYLPENIVSKLSINTNKFPPSSEAFCRDKIIKHMLNTFKQIESNLKLRKVGFFE